MPGAVGYRWGCRRGPLVEVACCLRVNGDWGPWATSRSCWSHRESSVGNSGAPAASVPDSGGRLWGRQGAGLGCGPSPSRAGGGAGFWHRRPIPRGLAAAPPPGLSAAQAQVVRSGRSPAGQGAVTSRGLKAPAREATRQGHVSPRPLRPAAPHMALNPPSPPTIPLCLLGSSRRGRQQGGAGPDFVPCHQASRATPCPWRFRCVVTCWEGRSLGPATHDPHCLTVAGQGRPGEQPALTGPGDAAAGDVGLPSGGPHTDCRWLCCGLPQAHLAACGRDARSALP